MDKSKENTRIQTLLDMSEEDRKQLVAMGIENPQIYKDFSGAEEFNWDYAVAAKLLTKEDVEWIKENVNEEETETPKEPADPKPANPELGA